MLVIPKSARFSMPLDPCNALLASHSAVAGTTPRTTTSQVNIAFAAVVACSALDGHLCRPLSLIDTHGSIADGFKGIHPAKRLCSAPRSMQP